MAVCFLCDAKLFGDQTRLCSSITTPHSNIPYPEKVAELMGDDFIVVVSPADHMCKTCTSLLTHMDKLEHNLKNVKNSLLSGFQKRFGLSHPDQPVQTLDTDDLEIGQKKHMNKEEEKANQPAEASAPIKNNASEELKLATKSEKSQYEEQTETMAEVNDHQLDKGTVNTDMVLNDNLSTRATDEQDKLQSMGGDNGIQEDTMNTQEDSMNTQGDTMNSQEDTMNSQEDDTMNSQEDDTMNSQEETMKTNNKTVDEKVTNGSEENNKASNLDIELAAIHHDEDLSSNIEDTQNIV